MTDCLCACHTNGAFPPPCDTPGGCHTQHAPEALCAVDGCRRVPDGRWTVCEPCGRHFKDNLTALKTAWDALTAAPSMQAPEPGAGGGHPLASQRSVGSMDVMTMRDRSSRQRDIEDPDGNKTPPAANTVFTYAAQVRDERPLSRPVITFAALWAHHPGPTCLVCGHESCVRRRPLVFPKTLTFETERLVLVNEAEWILGQDWAGECCTEIREALRGMERANGSGPAIPRPRARPCPDGCGGIVRLDMGPGGAVAACDRCTWERRGLAAAEMGAA